jgi:uncharacterized protein
VGPTATVKLVEIQLEIQQRVSETESVHPHWPCRKGCDDCCRSLAAVPRVTRAEWDRIVAALVALPATTSEELRERIRQSAGASRRVVCPLLDLESASCSVYDARPAACRAYGFYADRQHVLGCFRIETLAENTPDVIWGNHGALEARLARELGESAPLPSWLSAETR